MSSSSLYQQFFNKLPIDIACLLPTGSSKLVTFLNPYYIEKLKHGVSDVYRQFNFICSDGIVPIILNSMLSSKSSPRISFDMTSLAPKVFEKAIESNYSIYFLGSTEENICSFVRIISTYYPQLKIVGCNHGFIKGKYKEHAQIIIDSGADIAILGMGAPQQDEFAVFLKDQGFNGTIYTCGGFIHQTVSKLHYYPKWIDKYNLRTFYRLLKERYVWGRLFRYYPKFIINYSCFLFSIRFHSNKFLRKTVKW